MLAFKREYVNNQMKDEANQCFKCRDIFHLISSFFSFFPVYTLHFTNFSSNMAATLNFMTLNIRHDHHVHSPTTPFSAPPVKEEPFNVSEFGQEQPWSVRKWKVMDTIILYSPDVLALQA